MSKPNFPVNEPKWDAGKIVHKIRLWNDIFGEPPTLSDWAVKNITAIRIGEDKRELTEKEREYLTGNWPSHMSVIKYCGSFDKAIREAGLIPQPKQQVPKKFADTKPITKKPKDDSPKPKRVHEKSLLGRDAAIERRGYGTPKLILSRTKAVLEAHMARDIQALKSSLEELADAAHGWRQQIEEADKVW